MWSFYFVCHGLFRHLLPMQVSFYFGNFYLWVEEGWTCSFILSYKLGKISDYSQIFYRLFVWFWKSYSFHTAVCQLLGRNNSSFNSLVCRWRTITMLWWWEASVYSGWMLIQTSLNLNLWPSWGSACGSFGELKY